MDVTDTYQAAENLDASLYYDVKIVKKNVKVNDVNTVQISAKIKGADMVGAMDEVTDPGNSDTQMIEYKSLKPIKVTIWLNSKNYLPVKVSMDMTAFYDSFYKSFNSVMGEEIELNVPYAKSTVTYKNYNKATKFSFPKF